MLDYGYPQNCSADVLKMYITQSGDKSAAAERAATQAVTIQATGGPRTLASSSAAAAAAIAAASTSVSH